MLTHVSASQVENFDKCERSWYFKSIQRLQEPKKDHQALGTAIHRIVEQEGQGLTWSPEDVPEATTEQWDRAKLLAAEMIKILPRHITHREHKIEMETYPGGPTWIGYVDIGIRPGLGWGQLLIPADSRVGIIGDLKTTSDFKYIKSPQELADSVQMTSYAKWGISAPGLVQWDQEPPERIYLAHVYGLTKGKISEKSVRHSVACVDREQIEAKWSNTLDKVRRMSQVALSADAKQVAASGALTGHCQAYGGCAFREKCGIADNAIGRMFKLTQLGEKTDMSNTPTGNGSSLMDRINAARAKTNAPSTQTPATGNGATGAVQQAQPAAPAAATGNAVSGSDPVGTGAPSADNSQAGKAVAQGNAAPGNASHPAAVASVATGIIPPDAPPRDQPAHTITPPANQRQAIPAVGPGPSMGVDANSSVSGLETFGSTSVATQLGVSTSGAPTGSVSPSADGTAQKTSVESGSVGKRGRPSKADLEARKAQEEAEFAKRVEDEVGKRLASMGMTMTQGAAPTQDDEALAAEFAKRDTEISQLKAIRDRLLESEKALKSNLEQAEYSRNELAKSNQALSLEMAKAASSNAATQPQEPQGLVIYIDCYPLQGQQDLTLWESWSAPVAEMAAQLGEVPDWRLINYTSKGVFATAMREHIKSAGLPKALLIRSDGSGADIGLEVLIPLATRVVKGTR